MDEWPGREKRGAPFGNKRGLAPLRQRMIEDMNARKLCMGTQRGRASDLRLPPPTKKASQDQTGKSSTGRWTFLKLNVKLFTYSKRA